MPVKSVVSIKSNKVTYKISGNSEINVNGKWITANKIKCGDTITLKYNTKIIVDNIEIYNLHIL